MEQIHSRWSPLPDTRARQRHYKKSKLQTNISDKYRCKNPQQNINKSSSTVYRRIMHHDQVGLFQGCKDGSIFSNQPM